MLMIRFQRIGRTNDPAFRIVVLPKASGPKAGKFVDLVGTYNPKTKAITLQPERIKEWMAKGAQLSPSLHNLLITQGVLEGKKNASVVSKTNLEKNVQKNLAAQKAEAEAAAKAEADAKAAADKAEADAAAAVEAPAEEEVAPVEASTEEEVTIDAPAEVVAEAEATPAEEEATPVVEDVPAEEASAS